MRWRLRIELARECRLSIDLLISGCTKRKGSPVSGSMAGFGGMLSGEFSKALLLLCDLLDLLEALDLIELAMDTLERLI